MATVPGPGTEPKKAALADFLPRTAIKKTESDVEPISLRKSRRLSSLIEGSMTSPSSGDGGVRRETLDVSGGREEANCSVKWRRLLLRSSSLAK